MGIDDEHISVFMFGIRGRHMASEEIALAMAALLIPRAFGDAELSAQQPLSIEDGGDRWIVRGSRDDKDDPEAPPKLHHGPAIVEIEKANCRVLKLTMTAW